MFSPEKKRIHVYKKLRCNSTVKIRFGRKKGQGRFQHNPELWCGLRILFVRFFVVVLGGVFRFPNNLEKNLNKSFRKSYFLTF